MSSFHVDARINVKLEVELAIRLGELILKSGSVDKQILALGHTLSNIDKDEPVEDDKWNTYRRRSESSIVSDWQEEARPTPAVLSTMRDKVAKKYMKHDEERWGLE